MQFSCIFITGGVVSSLGKGLTGASLALLLERSGFRVAMLKLDPYLNLDPGTMNPLEHGEVYVTDDGVETDLDLGHYYRFTSGNLNKSSVATAGHIYDAVLKKERRGDFLGCTVQVIPHITNEIKSRIQNCYNSSLADIILVEIGGTVGDIESLPFLEAIRQFCYEHQKNCVKIHMTYVPYISAAKEVKTKPTQHSVQTLRSIGIIPDMIICRSEKNLNEDIKKKISLFCSVPQDAVFDVADVKSTIYELPLLLHKQKISSFICSLLNLKEKETINLSDWEEIVYKVKNSQFKVHIGIVGKYIQHSDAYKSIFEALSHASINLNCKVCIKSIDAENITEDSLKNIDGCLIPGGFGSRGWEGKIFAAKYCREQNIPCFGICLGLQVIVVEFARNVLGLKDANSTEIDENTSNPIICMLDEQQNMTYKGGTMRLGAFKCKLNPNSKAFLAYNKNVISERHRHRFEVNGKYANQLEINGLTISGVYEKNYLCEIVENIHHPWMLGCQFHPEFKSKPTLPHPLFLSFIKAILQLKKN